MIATSPSQEKVDNAVDRVLNESISASRLNLFHSCRLKFYFRYILRLKKPVGVALHVGRAVHAALQDWNKRRWLGKPSGVAMLKEAFESHWQADGAEEPVSFEEKEEEVEKLKAWNVVEMYLRDTPIPIGEKPEGVEVEVEADLSCHGLPKLRGFIDLVRPGGRIVDFKTSATSPNEEMAFHRNELQLTLYGILYRDATGRKEGGFELHHLVKTKTPKLVVTTHDPVTVKQKDKLFRSIDSFLEGVEREDWVSSPGLQCVSCEFFNECKGGLR